MITIDGNSNDDIKDALICGLVEHYASTTGRDSSLIIKSMVSNGVIKETNHEITNKIMSYMDTMFPANIMVTNNYTYNDIIGEGMFGTVYRCKNNIDNTDYAIKRLEYKNPSDLNEPRLMSRLYHDNIIRYHNTWFDSNTSSIFIQMELCDMSLKQWLAERNIFDIELRYIMLADIVSGVTYLHSKGIIHRDIKPSNILVKDNRLKICDLGICKIGDCETHTGYLGSDLYASPQQLSSGNYDHKTDYYSIGIIFFELCTMFRDDRHRIKCIKKLRSGKIMKEVSIDDKDWKIINDMMLKSVDIGTLL